jgi:hypothetical protein
MATTTRMADRTASIASRGKGTPAIMAEMTGYARLPERFSSGTCGGKGVRTPFLKAGPYPARRLKDGEAPNVASRLPVGVDRFHLHGVDPRSEVPDVRADGLLVGRGSHQLGFPS